MNKEDFLHMKIGTEIWTDAIAKSDYYQKEKNKFWATYKKIFKVKLPAKKQGYFVGYRYLFEGRVIHDSECGNSLRIKNTVFVVLIVFDPRQNAKYVFPTDCSLTETEKEGN